MLLLVVRLTGLVSEQYYNMLMSLEVKTFDIDSGCAINLLGFGMMRVKMMEQKRRKSRKKGAQDEASEYALVTADTGEDDGTEKKKKKKKKKKRSINIIG
ncbi:hypothetical protein Tco_1136707 [Tanacetum coccineum]